MRKFVVFLLVVGIVMIGAGCQSKQDKLYEDALKLYEGGYYKEAVDLIKQDAPSVGINDKISNLNDQALYALATQYYENESYVDAYEYFSFLSGSERYEDIQNKSKEKAEELQVILYQYGEKAYNDDEYETAKYYYEILGDYMDSADKLAICEKQLSKSTVEQVTLSELVANVDTYIGKTVEITSINIINNVVAEKYLSVS